MSISNSEVYSEKSPLSDKDCFVVFDRRKSTFIFPVHVHPEFELNFVHGAKGARRVVGDLEESISEKDLVLIANPELKHAWKDGVCKNKNIHEITIQFHPQLLEQFRNKNQFKSIRLLLEKAKKGLAFEPATIEKIQPLLHFITMETEGFYSVMRLFILLYELSKNEDYRELSSGTAIEMSRTTLAGFLATYTKMNYFAFPSLRYLAVRKNKPQRSQRAQSERKGLLRTTLRFLLCG